MDLEQIIFLVIAVGISIFSMYIKSKKRKQTPPIIEETLQDFSQPLEAYNNLEQVSFFDHYNDEYLLQNFNIHPKKEKKQKKKEKTATFNQPIENPKKNMQDAEFESESRLLEDFEGTEIQKAFLYSEIFKSVQN